VKNRIKAAILELAQEAKELTVTLEMCRQVATPAIEWVYRVTNEHDDLTPMPTIFAS
jgi:hypothetical protein